MTVLDKIKELKGNSKKRKFNQRYDLVINLKDFDINKSDIKVDEIFSLPKGSGKDTTITLFHSELKELKGCKIFNAGEIEVLATNKKALSNLINSTGLFLSEPKLMTVVGKHLGKFLAPRGLMPKPVVGDLTSLISSYKNGVRITIKKDNIIHTVVGSENMEDADVTENIKAVLEFLKSKLPAGKNNIGKVYLKFTMSRPIKLEVQ